MLAAWVLGGLLSRPISVSIHPDHTLRTFDPKTAFGAGIDGHEEADTERMLRPQTTRLMRTLGLQSLTYRLRTELGDEVWHWNPKGKWSDASHQQGYWVSSGKVQGKILSTYGYRLPRRGNTFDQANRDDYSRLTDGDQKAFWKSNPYLEEPYAGPMARKFPQWVVLDFLDPVEISRVQIDWGQPRASRFRLEYWTSKGDDPSDPGEWISTTATPIHGVPGRQTINVPGFKARWIKLALLESTASGMPSTQDPRDRMGFAIKELAAGPLDKAGIFHDLVQHGTSNKKQTAAYVSSTDPWHRAKDLDDRTNQPGFDQMLASRLDFGLPILMPSGCLFDVPENVEAEIRWLKARRVKLRGIEIGEEPDGNWGDPEHYGILYSQMARAIRRQDQNVRLGGPSFQTPAEDFVEFPKPGEPWLTRFVKTITQLGHKKDFQFGSFEWYPVDQAAEDPAKRIAEQPTALRATVERLQKLGFGRLPWMITEYGWSAFGSPVEADVPGAVFNMDVALKGLELGAETTYLYGYEANVPIEEVDGAWGNNMVLLAQGERDVRMPTFWGAWLLTREACALTGKHQLLETVSSDPTVGAYTIRSENGMKLVLCNRSPQSCSVKLDGRSGSLEAVCYDQTRFHWVKDGENSHPDRNLPPYNLTVQTDAIQLRPYAIEVVSLK